MNTELVIGAELLCTKSKVSTEVSLFMACSNNVCNALLGGSITGNRTSRIVGEDIIPYTKCNKNENCANIIETAPLWENLTLPFGEVKVPHINWIPLFSWNVVKNLNDEADERQFRTNYKDAENNNTGVGRSGYKFSDHELRQNANLQIYTDTGASPNASLSVNSILPCLGYGGIIHPKTDGQNPVYSYTDLFELVLSLPADDITPEAYMELARMFLYDPAMSLDKKATFISLCFDLDYRNDPNILQMLIAENVITADVWKANSDKFDFILGNMDYFATVEHAALVDKNGGSASEREQYFNTLHNIMVFDSAQNIRKPASQMGDSGPRITLRRTDPPDFVSYTLNGVYQELPINSYVLGYDKFEMQSVENPLIQRTTYMRFPKEVTVYCPAETKGLSNLSQLLVNNGLDMLLPSPYSGVPGAIRDQAVSVAIDVAEAAKLIGSATSKVASYGFSLLLSGYDIANDVEEARQQTRIIDDIRDTTGFINACIQRDYAGGVAVYSDEGIGALLRTYPPTFK